MITEDDPAITVVIRARAEHVWTYEITEDDPHRLFRGTVYWDGTHHLDLMDAVLTDYRHHAIERSQRPLG